MKMLDHNQLRSALAAKQVAPVRGRSFTTGLKALDALAPSNLFQGGAVHELLLPRQSGFPTSFALLLAGAAQKNGGAIAWTDPNRELYLPAISAAGIDLRHLILLRYANRADQLWALAECLRCSGISATVAFVPTLSQLEARRLQLAAERGGGVGIFMRPYSPRKSVPYAAATRWLIQPVIGSEGVQRWSVELLHGHGGQIGKVLHLEIDCETRQWTAFPSRANADALPVRISSALADRSAAPPPARATG